MKKRKEGFLSQENIDQDGEPFKYIAELHDYLWRFVRIQLPHSSGSLKDYIDVAIEHAEGEKRKES